MSYITTKDNTKLFYKDWGSGKPVIFMHGWPLSSDSWDDQAMAVANAGFRSVSYDRRGFGRSSHPWSGYDYNTLADELAAVIEQTGAKDVTLVGFSMGGGEVARYMSRHAGKLVAKAVLVSSIVPYMLKTEDNPKGTEQSTFDESENIDDFNERPWGIGAGKYRYDENGDWHGIYAMAFLDSHSEIEPIVGYGFQKVWRVSEYVRLGLGYTLGVTVRQDFDYVPVPLLLPLFSVKYKQVALQSTYVPGGYGHGNILFSWLRWELN